MEKRGAAKLTLHIPGIGESAFRRRLLSDPETMAYNRGYAPFPGYHPENGCIDCSEEDWLSWYPGWVGQEPERFYAYLRSAGGDFVGEVNFHPAGDAHEIGIVILAEYREKGYGREGLRLLLQKARSLGIRRLRNTFEPEREAAMRIHLAAGFRQVDTDGDCCVMEYRW